MRSNELLASEERVKPEYPKKNLTVQSEEPTNSYGVIMTPSLVLNPGHIGGRRVLSLQRHPCFLQKVPKYILFIVKLANMWHFLLVDPKRKKELSHWNDATSRYTRQKNTTTTCINESASLSVCLIIQKMLTDGESSPTKSIYSKNIFRIAKNSDKQLHYLLFTQLIKFIVYFISKKVGFCDLHQRQL